MRKDKIMSLSLDEGSATLLVTLAEKETEGNRSLLVRQWIRQAAGARGLFEHGETQPGREQDQREVMG